MAAEVASAYVTLLPSAKGFGPKVSKEIGAPVEKASGASGKRAGSVFARGYLGPLKAVGGLAVGLFAVDKVVGFFKAANSEARESQKVGALTTQVIKSTGGAAHVTAKQVGTLATAISNKSGIDDEAIQSGANLLLTFKNVRNEAGKGNDIFNQATQSITDLGAAMGKDPKAGAIQLGKALNDPVKGITALTRVGVSFTDQQKKQIKAMVASGDTLGAQKIILKELKSEFGGAAAASATNGEKLSTAFKNLEEQVGTAFLPVIDKVAGVLTTRIIPAISAFITGLQNGTGAGGAVRKVFESILSVLKPVAAFVIGTVVPAIKRLFDSFKSGNGPSALTAAFKAVVDFITTQVIPRIPLVVAAFKAVVDFITTQVVPRVMDVVGAFRGLIAALTPIVLQIVAVFVTYWPQISAVIAQVIQTVKVIVTNGLTIIAGIFRVVTAVIKAIWSVFGSSILSTIGRVLGAVLGVIKGALNIIQGVFKLFAAIFTGNWKGAWAAIKQIVSGAWQIIKSVISGAFAIIRGIFSAALAGLKALFALGWDALKSVVTAAWGKIKGAISTGISGAVGLLKSLPGKILGAVVGLDTLLYDAGKRLIQGFIDGIGAMVGKVKDTLGGLTDKLTSWKGPPRRDSTILHGAGQLVIGGFVSGMESEYGAVRSSLQRLTADVARPSLAVTGAGSAATRGISPGGTHVTIQGNVGWSPDEVARRIDVKTRDALAVAHIR